MEFDPSILVALLIAGIGVYTELSSKRRRKRQAEAPGEVIDPETSPSPSDGPRPVGPETLQEEGSKSQPFAWDAAREVFPGGEETSVRLETSSYDMGISEESLDSQPLDDTPSISPQASDLVDPSRDVPPEREGSFVIPTVDEIAPLATPPFDAPTVQQALERLETEQLSTPDSELADGAQEAVPGFDLHQAVVLSTILQRWRPRR